MQKISFIIPTLNEETFLVEQKSFFKLLIDEGHEIIVVDGGSKDHSLNIAKSLGCKAISTKPSRGLQQHKGANISVNEVLVFLHADTTLPASALLSIKQVLSKPDIAWGRFNVSFTNQKLIYKVIAWFMNKRSCLTGIVSGDHALFVKREVYFECGGFSDIPIMEDVDISKKLKKYSKPICIKDSVTTSSRKWEKNGVLNTIFLMWCLRFLFYIGIPADKLAKHYY